MLYTDIPSDADVARIATERSDAAVSVYLPTTPVSTQTEADRIQLRNLAREAVTQLEAAGLDRGRVQDLQEELDDLVDDDAFWAHQAHGLAVFATPDHLRTFRLPTTLQPMVEVSDRFHLKPLLRSVTFPNSAYVLALSEAGVRVVEVGADLPARTVAVDGLPRGAADEAGKASIAGRSPSGRIVGSEGKKVRLRAYARAVDAALRTLPLSDSTPLVLAATEPLRSIYRSVASSPHLLAAGIETSPERVSDADLASAARPVLDAAYEETLTRWRATYEQRLSEGRATADVAHAARAATFGGVESVLVDMDRTLPGLVDEETGAVTFDDAEDAVNYGVVDEIARRVLASSGRVLAVRAADLPSQAPLAAILRYRL